MLQEIHLGVFQGLAQLAIPDTQSFGCHLRWFSVNA